MKYKIQPASHVDHITDDGTQLTKRPYPIVTDEQGNVLGSALGLKHVVGFVRDLSKQQVDVLWSVALRDMSRVPGMYVVVCNDEGGFATLSTAVETFEMLSEPLTSPTGPQRVAVHMSHCCKRHGCKYGAWLAGGPCPVEAGEVEQQYPCEACEEDAVKEPPTAVDLAAARPDELLHDLREAQATWQAQRATLAAEDAYRLLDAMTATFNELDYRMSNLGGLTGSPSDWR